MPNTLYQPLLNPIKFVEENPSLAAQYNSTHMDDWRFVDTIETWMEQRTWCMPWQTNDTIRLQFFSDYGPHTFTIIDRFETVHGTVAAVQLLENEHQPGMYIYQATISLAGLDDDIYYLKWDCAASMTLISEPLIISETHPETVLLEYQHTTYYGDILWAGTGFAPSLRTPGRNKYKSPASKSTQYEDQTLNLRVLDKKPFRTYELTIGDAEGVPDYFIDKIDRILGCTSLLIDGHGFVQADGAKWDEIAEASYPMRGWKIDMRETSNRASVIYENDTVVPGVMAVAVNVDSKGFGLDNTGGNVYQVTDVS